MDGVEKAELYRKEQEQRRRERKLRELRRKRDGCRILGDREGELRYKREIREKSRQLQTLADDNDLTRLKARERNWVRFGTYSETTEQITRLPGWEKTQQALPPVTYEEKSQELHRGGQIRGQTIHYRMSTLTENPIGISTRLTWPETADNSVRFYDRMLSDAQALYRKHFNLDGRELPRTIILSDDEIGPRILASYSAELNTLFLRERVFDKQSLCVAIEAVKTNNGISGSFFALESQPLATFVHELAHWLHAEYARSHSTFGPDYGLHDRMWLTAQAVIEKVIKHYPDFDFG